jgi:hypothetical protein
MNGSQYNPSGGQGTPSRRPGGGPPPLGPKRRAPSPGTPTGRASGWSTGNRVLLGMGLGLLIVVLGIASLLVSLRLSQRMASVARPDSPDQITVLPSEPTSERVSPPQPIPPGSPKREALRPTDALPSETPDDAADFPPPPEADPADDGAEEPAEQDIDAPAAEETGAEEAGAEEMAPEAPDADGTDEAAAAAGVFADILGQDRRLFLPEPGVSGPVELAKVLVDSPAECELSLHGMEIVFENDRTPTIEQADADNARTWTILVKAGLGKGRPIAIFSLASQSLTYEWKTTRFAPNTECLRYCLLTLKAKSESISCFLCKPREVEPLKLSFRRYKQAIDIPLDVHWLPRAEHLRIDLEFANFPPHEVDPSEDVGHKELATVHFPPDTDPEAVEDFADVEIWFEASRRCRLYLKTLGYPKMLGNGRVSEGEVKIDRSFLASQKRDLKKLKSQVKALQQKIDVQLTRNYSTSEKQDLQRLNRQNAERSKAVESIEVWFEGMQKLIEVLETDGRIKFRLYVEIEDEQIVLVQTSDEGDTD